MILQFVVVDGFVIAQDNQEVEANSKREEVQRYFGYEALLPAYMTLPIDASTNSNERGYFIEIGFLLLILLPIVVLWRLREKNKLLSIGFVLLCLIIQVLYVSSGFLLNGASSKIFHGRISDYLATQDSTVDHLLGSIYIVLNNIGAPLLESLENISGHRDYISYPLLVIFFIGVLFLFTRLEISRKNKLLLIFSSVFAFFWLILSAGIIWYGFLMFPILFILVYAATNSQKSKGLKYAVLSLTAVWLIVAFATRVSFIALDSNFNPESAGKMLLNSLFFSRSIGNTNSNEVIDKAHPSLTSIQNQINREPNSLILRVGTTLGYFIKNNGDRIVQDNQLSFFDVLVTRYQSSEQINKALKIAGFRYLLIDLNTATLDRTPERTLTAKFQKLSNYISSNSQLRLMGTDRIIEVTRNGQTGGQYGLAGRKVLHRGTYAVFELL